MVKSLIGIGVSLALLLGAFLFEWLYPVSVFTDFGREVSVLAVKVEEERASEEDGKLVVGSWERKKSVLHVFIPHGDVSRIDDILTEAVGLISEKEYSLALAKLDVLIHLSACLPDTYRPSIENIF